MADGVFHFLRRISSQAATPNGARQAEFMFLHLALLTILAVVAVTIYVAITTVEFSLLLILSLALLSIVGAVASSWMFQAAEFADQHGRDLQAVRIVSRVMKGARPKSYCVLIRPFSNGDQLASNALPASPFGRILSSGPVYAGPAKPMAMESQLRRAVDNTIGPLMTFGAPVYAPGAGRAPVSAKDWEAVAGEVADNASVIFFTPGIDKASRAALEELLESDIIRRTIIVEPGALDEPHSNDVEADSVIRWNSLRSLFAQHGYALPPKSEHGALIYFGVAGAEPHVVSFGAWHTRHLRLFLTFVKNRAAQAKIELGDAESEDANKAAPAPEKPAEKTVAAA